ncbi:MAG TPA: tRNA pseudouridine(13) synthase TruD [Candidatus Nanoarchaeia archaeon]|nr:tRNA pseudouridine(13) synthase TruD [Candidatus Nanoarchaeia archaeon]
MGDFDRGSVVFKHSSDDFIVQEISEDGVVAKISENKEIFNKTPDLSKINIDDRRTFLSCEMEKINIDHFNAIQDLCFKLGKQAHEIGFAGTKDKTAWTCQRISIFDPDIEKIKQFSHPNIYLKNFKWIKHKIKIGDLKGNQFRIVLRDADDQALKVLNRLRNSTHLPNLFGMQRFGTRKDNFTIGRLILKKKFQEAVLAYLIGYGDKEKEEIKKAKKRLQLSKDIQAAVEYFPLELHTEHKMIQYLIENPKDYIGALKIIGEKALLIMCQSVQSHLFNEILERGMEEKIISKDSEISLIGYDYKDSNTRISRIEQEILQENSLSTADFKVEALPYLSLRFSKRKALFEVQNLDITTEEDELFKPSKKIKLSFQLDSGSYATTLLDNFFELRY